MKKIVLLFLFLGSHLYSQFIKEQYVSNSSISIFAEDNNGLFWVSIGNEGLSKFNETSNKFESNNRITEEFGHINDVFVDSKGITWFINSGVVKYVSDKVWTRYTTSDGLISNIIYSIKEDKNGNMWFGTVLGISKFDKNTKWTNYQLKQPLWHINSITVDRKIINGLQHMTV